MFALGCSTYWRLAAFSPRPSSKAILIPMKLQTCLLIAVLAGCSTDYEHNSSPSNGAVSEFERRAAQAPDAATRTETTRPLEEVAAFHESMPTGVTVAGSGRIFVNFPRWGDPVPFTVAEMKNGQATPFPDAEINKLDQERAAETFVSVQSVVVDPRDRLWVLDTGSIKMEPAIPNGPKLVGINLTDNRVFKTIQFPSDVALPSTYLNDLRFDLRQGQDGVAYITDSSDKGANGIIVVDLASGKSWRRLHNHPSTKAEQYFVPIVEDQPLMQDKPGQPAEHIRIGSDGIAISSDGERLFYCPLASRKLYSVATEALLNQSLTDAQVGETVKDEGAKPASDGLESDAEGGIYATDYEHNAIVRRNPDRKYEIIARDPRMLWPDTLSVASDGYLYFTANQLHRQPNYHDGQELRRTPYYLFRVRIDAQPVRLGSDTKQVVRERIR
jgi:sugar lactone lactonase YvrE